MREQTYDGEWWRPEDADRRVGGRMKFSPQHGLRLTLFGLLLDDLDRQRRRGHLPVILGNVSSMAFGNDVTLLACRWDGDRLHGTYQEQHFRSDFALLGVHLPSPSSAVVTGCDVSFTNLDTWVDVSGLVVAAEADEGYHVRYDRPALPELETSVGAIALTLKSPFPFVTHRAVDVREWCSLAVRATEPHSVEEFRYRILWPLQNFMTFATNRANAITDIQMIVAGHSSPVGILFRHPFIAAISENVLEMLFKYSDVKSRLADVLDRWFSLYCSIGSVLNSLVAIAYQRVTLPDAKFLALAQAAESYHRNLTASAPTSPAAHAKRVAEIMEAYKGPHRGWLAKRLKQPAEMTLPDRIQSLFDRLGEEFLAPMLGASPPIADTAQAMGKWRNDLAHLKVSPEFVVERLLSLHVATNRLLITLQANILLDLGFARDDLGARFRHNDEYRYSAGMTTP